MNDDTKGSKKNPFNKNCPDNHGLNDFKTTNNTFICDGCRGTQETGTQMWGCRKCNYDLCANCLASDPATDPLCFCGATWPVSSTRYTNWKCQICHFEYGKTNALHLCSANNCIYDKIREYPAACCGDCYNAFRSETPADANETDPQKIQCDRIAKHMQTLFAIQRRKFDKLMASPSDFKVPANKWVTDMYQFCLTRWIAKLKLDVPGWNDTYEREMMNSYNSLYDHIVLSLSQGIDRTSLKADDSIFDDYDGLNSENLNNLDETQKKLLKLLKIEWMGIIGDSYENDYVSGYSVCKETENNIYKCESLKRMQFIMTQYRRFYIEKYDEKKTNKQNDDANDDSDEVEMGFLSIWNECVFKYNTCNFINDFSHLMEEHILASVQDVIDLKDGVLVKFCKSDNCQSMQRKFREKSGDDDSENKHSLYHECKEDDDFILVDQIDKVHSFIYHVDGLVVPSRDKKRPNAEEKKQSNDDDDNSDDDDDDEIEDVEIKRIEKRNQRPKAKKRPEKDQKQSKFVTQVDVDDDDESNKNAKKGDAKSIPSFEFGQLFYYWKGYSHYNVYVPEGYYKNLKEELLTNKIQPISMDEWNRLVLNASRMKLSRKGKSMLARSAGGTNQRYCVAVAQPISIGHLASVLLYTNFTSVQFKFKKHCMRLAKTDRDWQDIVPRHKEIVNWAKLMTEAVIFWGVIAEDHERFYHGLSCKLLFNQFSPKFKLPLSTTDDIEVANSFGNGVGIILILKPMKSCLDKYLDVSWMSQYPEEREKLFYKSFQMTIYDIRSCGDGRLTQNSTFIAALVLIDNMLKNEYYIKDSNHKQMKKTQRCLLKMIKNYMSTNEVPDIAETETEKNSLKISKINVPTYIQQLFNHFITTKKEEELIIAKSDYECLRPRLKKYLVSSIVSETDFELGPFFKSFTTKDKVEFGYEIVWKFENEELTKFKAMRTGEIMRSPDFNYRNEFTWCLSAKKSRPASPEYSDIGIRVKTQTKKFTQVKVDWNYCVDEARYVSNGQSSKLRKDAYQGFRSYKHHLITDAGSIHYRFAISVYYYFN